MRFWDTSALVPLCVSEPRSKLLREVLSEDGSIAVWWCTPVECASAFARRRRDGELSTAGEVHALAVLNRLEEGWSTVGAVPSVRQRAMRLVRVHPLRAADAFQLAAALLWLEQLPAGREVVSLDQRLREATQREGFAVVPETI